ncbi:MAG: hypothetical protein M1819_004459 [Sarea resinae]|nr:MAG: hypothetical protein M1819_004459 [Sarea resinae]
MPSPPAKMADLATTTSGDAAVAAAVAAAPPRKRRRRAPTTGAADDCFTCRKQRRKCDRRRPYCSQCLDQGEASCSGYKTQLTWGVGVASRGKLRGMALPIAAPKKTSSSTSAPSQKIRNPATSSSKPADARSGGNALSPQAARPIPIKMDSPVAPYTNYDFVNMDPTSSPNAVQLSNSAPDWQTYGVADQSARYGPVMAPRQAHDWHGHGLQRLHTSIAGSYEELSSAGSATSIGGYSDSDYPSPVEYPHTPDDVPPMDIPMPGYHEYYAAHAMATSPNDSLVFHGRTPTSCPITRGSMASSAASDQSSYGYVPHNHLAAADSRGSYNFSREVFEDEVSGGAPSPHDVEQLGYGWDSSVKQSSSKPTLTDEDPPETTASTTSSSSAETQIAQLLPSLSITSRSPRMQYLIDYYDKAICPVLVSSDGLTNPYRMYVLPLAMQSKTLQNAIGALAANNLRMRLRQEEGNMSAAPSINTGARYQNAMSSPSKLYAPASGILGDEMASLLAAAAAVEAPPPASDDSAQEESHLKATSIQLLNQQLANPSLAMDDSVLATILILCLFHTCETGIAQFKTQFAGVRKLLDMSDDDGPRSGFRSWVEFFFTWVEVMTAAVNDREPELRKGYLDLVSFLDLEGGVAHLTGCDGRLFNTIAKLGRLNVLSQNRPIFSYARDSSTPTTMNASENLAGPRSRSCYSPNYSRLDGNGWNTPLDDDDDINATSGEDSRFRFWEEWHAVRQALQDWTFEAPPTPQPSPHLPHNHHHHRSQHSHHHHHSYSPSHQRDLLHASEAFRYAALLYTERLAYPSLPSSRPNLQNLVAQALYHITSIAATTPETPSPVDKFLLWPLFLTGTECVAESHRDIVRRRCMGIMIESGFGNNGAGLGVLERVWRGEPGGNGNGNGNGEGMETVRGGGVGHSIESAGRQQAFRWRRAMEGVDGDYIMI